MTLHKRKVVFIVFLKDYSLALLFFILTITKKIFIITFIYERWLFSFWRFGFIRSWLPNTGGSGSPCAKGWSWVQSWPAAWSCSTASPPHRSTSACLSKNHHAGARSTLLEHSVKHMHIYYNDSSLDLLSVQGSSALLLCSSSIPHPSQINSKQLTTNCWSDLHS